MRILVSKIIELFYKVFVGYLLIWSLCFFLISYSIYNKDLVLLDFGREVLFTFVLGIYIHEYSHFFVALVFIQPEMIKIKSGLNKVSIIYYSTSTKSFLISLAGPISNLVLALYFVLFKSLMIFDIIVFLNLAIFLSNLYPSSNDGKIVWQYILTLINIKSKI